MESIVFHPAHKREGEDKTTGPVLWKASRASLKDGVHLGIRIRAVGYRIALGQPVEMLGKVIMQMRLDPF